MVFASRSYLVRPQLLLLLRASSRSSPDLFHHSFPFEREQVVLSKPESIRTSPLALVTPVVYSLLVGGAKAVDVACHLGFTPFVLFSPSTLPLPDFLRGYQIVQLHQEGVDLQSRDAVEGGGVQSSERRGGEGAFATSSAITSKRRADLRFRDGRV